MNDIHFPFRLMHQLRASDIAPSAPSRPTLRRASRLLSLEQRFMFDGAAVATAADAAHAQPDPHAAAMVAEAAAAVHQVREVDPARNDGKKEVAFVDTSVANYKMLEAGIRAGVEIVEIDGSRSGLAQIAAWAASHEGYDAVHILSHGAAGKVYLGSDTLSASTLGDTGVQAELAQLGHALKAGGDLLIYGCDVAASDSGQHLIAGLAAATGADVAASDDPTGTQSMGGDWVLEKNVGAIETRIAVTDEVVLNYHSVLANATLTFESGTGFFSNVGSTAMSFTEASTGVTFTFTAQTAGGGADHVQLGSNYGASYHGAEDVYFGVDDIDASATMTIQNGKAFTLNSLYLSNQGSNDDRFVITTNKGGSYVSNLLPSGVNSFQVILPGTDDFKGITWFKITPQSGASYMEIDDIALTNIVDLPTVTDARISISSTGSGPGGVYRIGDTVTAQWNNTASGDNNTGIVGVKMDFSQFGGGNAVTATETSPGSGIWTASYVITAGSIDATGRNVSVTADNGATTTTADSTNLSVDNAAPVVTDGRISISGGSGTGGAYKIGDTVTATWNNTSGGDNNGDITGVTVDFSAFGGGSTVAASNSGGTWTATYTITAGSIDLTNRNISVTATDNAGNTKTTADTTNATVDNIAPTVSDAQISISGGSGTGGAYRIGDTVTATWNASGDGNTDTLTGVTVNFSQFGGGSVAATNAGGVWTAIYTIVAGAINGLSARNITVTATDNAGNTTTTSDTTNATVDNQRPTTTIGGLALNPDTGSSSTDFVTNTAAQTITGTLSAGLTGGEQVYGSLDNGSTWVNITSKVSGTTLTWNGVTLMGSNTLKLKVTDAAGNDGTTASQAYTLDTTAPAAPSAPDMTAGTDTGASSTDNITKNTTPVFTGTAESGATVTLYDSDGTTVLGTTTATGGVWSITASALAAGSHSLTAKATDAAGNTSAASSPLVVTIDTTAPTGLGLSSSTISSLSAGSGSAIATLSSTDALAVTYSLVAGNGTNDANNGSFSISGNTLQVGGASLSAGTYKLYVAATDAAGNVANQAFTLTVVDAPSISSIVRSGGASSTVGNAAASISYTVTFSEAVTGVDAGDFTLSASGTAGGSIASVTGSGTTYTVMVDTLTGDGTLRLDLNGSGTGIRNGGSVEIVGGYTSGASYTLDHTAPAAPSTPDMTAATDTGISNADNITRNTTPVFTGTAESGTTVTLYDTDGTTVLGTTTATGGSWSITSSTLSAGAHTITAKATDAAGNTSAASSGLNVVIDTTAPTLSISSNVASLKAGDTATITFTFSEDPGATFTWSGSSGDVVVSGGTLSAISGSGLTRTAIFTPTAGVNSGTASISVTGGSYTDAAGNSGGGGLSPSLTFDTLAPAAPSTPDMSAGTDSGSSSTDNITSNTAPVFTGTAESGSTVTLYDTDGTTILGTAIATGGNWSITSAALSEGAHTITAKATDAAGNSSTVSSGLSVTIDTSAPTQTVATVGLSSDTGSSASDFVTRTAAQTISGTLSANLGSDEIVQISLDNGATWQVATASAGSNTWSYNTTLSGSDTLKVRVVDAAGNIGAVHSQAYVLDTTAPDVNSVSVPANGFYYTNQNLDFTVHFSEAVTIDTTGGTPRIALVIGATTVYATYQSGSGTSDLVFRYVIADGDQDFNGITVGALNTNGGSMRDAAGNDATLTMNSVGSTASVNVDGTVPRIVDVSASTVDGGYKAGDTVSLTVTFNHAVTVDTTGGTPSLALNSGGSASYTSGSGGTTLVFTYIVGAGQNTVDLDYNSTAALALNGGTIKSGSGGHPDALITLLAPGASGSLGANKAIVIDTTPPAAPTVESVSTSSLAPVLSGDATLEAGGSLTITVGGATYHVIPSGGHWSLDLASASPASGSLGQLVLGQTYNVTATVTDAVGNINSASGVLALAAPESPASPQSPTPGNPAVQVPPPRPVLTSVNPAPPVSGAAAVASVSTGEASPLAPVITPFAPPALESTLWNASMSNGTGLISASLFSLARSTAAFDGQGNGDRFSQTSLTQGSGFHVVVLPASANADGLVLNRGIGDQALQASGHTEFSIPPDAFAHTDPNAAIQLSARQPDGRPLPNWVRFDARNGKFIIDAPGGMNGDIAVKVTARDARGQEVTTIFRIRVSDRLAQSHPHTEHQGRTGLSEQLHLAAQQRSQASALGPLAQLANALQWPNS